METAFALPVYGFTAVTVVRFTGNELNERIFDFHEDNGVSVANSILLGRRDFSNELIFSLWNNLDSTTCQIIGGTIEPNAWTTIVARYSAQDRRVDLLQDTNWTNGSSSVGLQLTQVGSRTCSYPLLTSRTLSEIWVGKGSSGASLSADLAGLFVIDEYMTETAAIDVAEALIRGDLVASTQKTDWCTILANKYSTSECGDSILSGEEVCDDGGVSGWCRDDCRGEEPGWLCQNTACNVSSCSKVKDEFVSFDLDGDFVLSVDEFVHTLTDTGWSLQEAEQAFRDLDRNGDGGISAQEFEAWVEVADAQRLTTDNRCAPGTTGPDGGPCTPCTANTFKNVTGSDLCAPCPRYSTSSQGSAQCQCDSQHQGRLCMVRRRAPAGPDDKAFQFVMELVVNTSHSFLPSSIQQHLQSQISEFVSLRDTEDLTIEKLQQLRRQSSQDNDVEVFRAEATMLANWSEFSSEMQEKKSDLDEFLGACCQVTLVFTTCGQGNEGNGTLVQAEQISANECLACRRGYYKQAPDNSDCIPCPHRMETQSVGAVSQSQCQCKWGYSLIDFAEATCARPGSLSEGEARRTAAAVTVSVATVIAVAVGSSVGLLPKLPVS